MQFRFTRASACAAQVTEDVRGVVTDLIVSAFTDVLFVAVTQYRKLGNMVCDCITEHMHCE